MSEKALRSLSDVNQEKGLDTDAPFLPSSLILLPSSLVLIAFHKFSLSLLTPAHFFQTSGGPSAVDRASAPQTHTHMDTHKYIKKS